MRELITGNQSFLLRRNTSALIVELDLQVLLQEGVERSSSPRMTADDFAEVTNTGRRWLE